jgi:hypothetical protein
VSGSLLHDELVALADLAEVPPLDLDGLRRTAGRRRRRTVGLAGAATALIVAAGASTVFNSRDSSSLQPAGRPPATAQADRVVPSADGLETAARAIDARSQVVTAQEYPGGYLAPGTSAFADRNRLGRVTAGVELRDGTALSVAWDALDRPLDPDEAERFLGYPLEYDETQPEPARRLLEQEDGPLSGLRLWRTEDPTTGPGLVLAAWAANGTTVVLRQAAPAGAQQAVATERMLGLARILTAGVRSHGRAGPLNLGWVPDGVEFRRNGTAPFEAGGAEHRGTVSQTWEGVAGDGRQLTVNVTEVGGEEAQAVLARAATLAGAARVPVRGTSAVLLRRETPALFLVDGSLYVQVLGARGTTGDDLLRVARGLSRLQLG